VPRPPWPWLPGTPARRVERGAACETLLKEPLGAIEREARRLGVGAGAGNLGALGNEVGSPLVYLRAVHRGVDLRERVPFFDLRVEVDEHVRDPAIDLGAHIDLENRLHGARGLHFLDHVSHGGDRGDVFGRRERPMVGPPHQPCRDGDDGDSSHDAATKPKAAPFFGC